MIKKDQGWPKESIDYTKTTDGPVFVLPEIVAVSTVFHTPKAYPYLYDCYCYRIHMINCKKPLSFIFDNAQKARRSREQLILRLIHCLGADAVLFTNGWDGWITVISAIRRIGEINAKDHQIVFPATVSNVVGPIDFVFKNVFLAEQRRSQILSLMNRWCIDQNGMQLSLTFNNYHC